MSFRASALYIQDTVPKSVSRIGEYAFRDCHNLLNVYCYAEKVSETGTNIFMESNIKNAILHVPWFYIPDYEKTSPWSGFGKIVALTPWETGIDELKGENGKRETAVYDLSGRRVQKAQKGVCVQNGKVVLVR